MTLTMIFNPKNRHTVGPFVFHGLFLKRQKDVARSYANLVANRVFAPENILKQVLRGPYSDRIFSTVARRVGAAIDESAGMARSFLSWSVGGANYLRLKETAVTRLMERTPDVEQERTETTQAFIKHVDETMGIEAALVERMEQLPPPKFDVIMSQTQPQGHGLPPPLRIMRP